MPPIIPPDLSIVLYFLRSGQGWSQAKLGEALGISPNLINDYERGRKPLQRPRLEVLIAAMNLPPTTIDECLAVMERNRASSRVPAEIDGRSPSRLRVEALAARTGKLAADFVRETLSLLTREAEGLQARQRAQVLWERLKLRSKEEQLALVEDARRFRSWALVERVARESIVVAADDPRKALALAELALRIAELCPGSQAWRERLMAYALAHVANARRVLNDLAGAAASLEEAKRLWEAGATGDPGFLNEVWFWWIEATLRDAERRFPQALRALDRALMLDQGELRGQILLTKAQILTAQGDLASSTTALTEAASLTDSRSAPRIAMAIRFQIVVNLCHAGRAEEAALRLPEVRHLAEGLGNELDIVRAVWLSGMVSAGLGSLHEAEGAYEQVRREFAARSLAYDHALVSIELALVLLRQDRTGEVLAVSEAAFRMLQSKGAHEGAVAALGIFCAAVKRAAATVELARQLVLYLYRAERYPELRFEP